MAKIIVQDTEITVLSHNAQDYISLTDMANGKQSESRAADIIKNWIRTRYTIEFLGIREIIHNPGFKVVEFDHFRLQAGQCFRASRRASQAASALPVCSRSCTNLEPMMAPAAFCCALSRV